MPLNKVSSARSHTHSCKSRFWVLVRSSCNGVVETELSGPLQSKLTSPSENRFSLGFLLKKKKKDMHKTLNHPEKGRWRGRYSFLVQPHLLSCLPGLCAALPLFCSWLGHGTLQGIEAVAVRGALVNSSGVFPGLVWHCEPLFWLPVPAGELRSLCREPGLPTSPSVVRPVSGRGDRCRLLPFSLWVLVSSAAEVQMYVCNKEMYGFLPVPLRAHSTLQDEAESFMHVQLEVMGESPDSRGGPSHLPFSPSLHPSPEHRWSVCCVPVPLLGAGDPA